MVYHFEVIKGNERKTLSVVGPQTQAEARAQVLNAVGEGWTIVEPEPKTRTETKVVFPKTK